jgi:hypothetical protein
MAAVAEKSYSELLLAYEPSVIKTEEENQRALKTLSEILSKGEKHQGRAAVRRIAFQAHLRL